MAFNKEFGILVILIVIIFAGVLFFQKNNTLRTPVTNIPTEMISPTPAIPLIPSVSEYPISFENPGKLSTKYIFPYKWPPQVTATDGEFTCEKNEPGKNGLPNTVTKKIINNRAYCIRNKTEGAAGSIYSEYTYTVEKYNRPWVRRIFVFIIIAILMYILYVLISGSGKFQ